MNASIILEKISDGVRNHENQSENGELYYYEDKQRMVKISGLQRVPKVRYSTLLVCNAVRFDNKRIV